MNRKVANLLAFREAAMEQEGREMWRAAIAETVIDLLNEGKTVTPDTLRQTIEAQIASTKHRFLRGRLIGAINVLDGLAPHA